MTALVLSGGGSRGSWQAGVIQALSQNPRFFRGFEFVSGSSVGALNAAGLAMYNRTELVAAANNLKKLWHSKLDVWRLRFPPYLSALWKPSLGRNNGLKTLIKKEINKQRIRCSDVSLSITAVDLLTGELARWTHSSSDLVEALLASSSVPVAFPPTRLCFPQDRSRMGMFTDGGVRDVAPLGVAIKHGAKEVVVVLTSNPYHLDSVGEADVSSVLEVATRTTDIMVQELMKTDIEQCLHRNTAFEGHSEIRLHVIYPSKTLRGGLDFGQKKMKKWYAQGYKDAQHYFVDYPAGIV